jgi:predicted chitinase
MANFQKAPISLLTSTPASLPQAVRDVLARPGTYSIFDDTNYRLKVPIGNTTWKGEQARLIGLWGGDEAGNRLDVTADPPIVDVTLISEAPVAPHLWAWLVQPGDGANPGETRLLATTRVATPGRVAGALYASPLPVTVMPEEANVAGVPDFANGSNRQQTVDAIIAECHRQRVNLDTQIAYILATAEHESNFTPLREQVTVAREPQRRRLGYYPYYGRGFVQLTHEGNYANYGRRLVVDMVSDPDLALQANIALFVLVHGVINGSFGTALTHFVNAQQTDFVHARQSVNGMDRSQHIADLAQNWLRVLTRAAHAAPP